MAQGQSPIYIYPPALRSAYPAPDDRKDDLLLNTTGAYELNLGWIDTTNLAAGHYVLTLVPASRIDVLRADADLSVSQPGGVLTPAGSVNGAVSIEFDIEEWRAVRSMTSPGTCGAIG